ncbi:MAG TPA: hypothetical protein VLC48_05260 [Gemmatimonadota bacterium]|nr:hypothetical protein [Gemmatimonadota bacterium]
MKVGAVALPVVVVALVFTLAWAVSMATLQAGFRALEGGLELARLQIKVARMQHEVLSLSRQRLEQQFAELEALAAPAVPESPETVFQDDPSAGTVEVDGNRAARPRREWPRLEPQSGPDKPPDK